MPEITDEVVEAAARAFDAAVAARQGDHNPWVIYETWFASATEDDERAEALTKLADLRAERMEGMRAALEAALPLLEGDGWRPIESAPRDGTHIMVPGQFSGMEIDEAQWDEDTNPEGWWSVKLDLPLEPTHWQPLPAPPQQALAKTEGRLSRKNMMALSPVEKALHDAERRRSFVRGQLGHDPGPDVLAEEVKRLRALLAEAGRVLEPFDRAAAWADGRTYGTWIIRARDLIAAGPIRTASDLAARIKGEIGE